MLIHKIHLYTLIIIVALSAAMMISCSNAPKQEPLTQAGLESKDENGGDSLVLLFTGDVLLDRSVRPQIERHGVEWLFDSVQIEFRQADAVIVNLECPLADTLTPLTKRYIFHADTRWAKELRHVGITHAALANNHTNDQGYQGLVSTVKALEDNNIIPLGIGLNERERLTPVVIEKGERKIALFNAVLFPLENWIPNTQAEKMLPCQVDAQTLARAVHEYKEKNPNTIIITVLHWGIEFQTTPSRKQRQEAAMLVSAGAEVIIGHHPHVLQPLSQVFGKPVYFSLGNFVFDQHPIEARKGGMARIVIRQDSISCRLDTVSIENCRPIPYLKEGM